jgi:hypothetical protein
MKLDYILRAVKSGTKAAPGIVPVFDSKLELVAQLGHAARMGAREEFRNRQVRYEARQNLSHQR